MFLVLFFICPALQNNVFTIGTELMRHGEEEVNFEDGPFYTFSGFNVSTAVFIAARHLTRHLTLRLCLCIRTELLILFLY